MKKRTAPRRAMTLIEVLAATALSVLLMTAAIGVLASLTKQRQALFGGDREEPWQRQFVERLRWDLSNARKIRSQPGELRLIGYGGVDFETAAAMHRPCEIIYSIRTEGNRHWLVRRETHLDSDALHNSRTEVVAVGATSLAAYDQDATDEPELDQGNSAQQVSNVATIAVPNRLRVIVRGEAKEKMLVDEQIVLQ